VLNLVGLGVADRLDRCQPMPRQWPATLAPIVLELTGAGEVIHQAAGDYGAVAAWSFDPMRSSGITRRSPAGNRHALGQLQRSGYHDRNHVPIMVGRAGDGCRIPTISGGARSLGHRPARSGIVGRILGFGAGAPRLAESSDRYFPAGEDAPAATSGRL